jgi:hypothetical protein
MFFMNPTLRLTVMLVMPMVAVTLTVVMVLVVTMDIWANNVIRIAMFFVSAGILATCALCATSGLPELDCTYLFALPFLTKL